MVTQYHNPVLLEASIEGLNIIPNGTYVDVTFGGGGHSKAILNCLDVDGRLLGFDQDTDAFKNVLVDSRFDFIHSNFSNLSQYLKYHKAIPVEGILADFGVSSHQFNTRERGFSTRLNARLDMRMNQSQPLDAFEIINNYSEEDLKVLFYVYGELKNSKAIAAKIIDRRNKKTIETSMDLIDLLSPLVPIRIKNKIFAQIFQALRIEVNDELEVLKSFLLQATTALAKGGRLVCISYHSLEDRLVKRFIRNGLFEGEPERDVFGNFEVPFKKVGRLIIPSPKEIKMNNRARSAKLRIAEKL